jgi:acyl carrier protein
MDRQTFLPLLDEMLELPAGTLKGPEKLQDLDNWNSLAMVSFVALADEHFDATVSPRRFVNCETVNDLLSLIKALDVAA